MLVAIPDVLSPEVLTQAQALLKKGDWVDGRVTAGLQSAQSKHNWQLPETSSVLAELRAIVLGALDKNAWFFTAALPKRVMPPLFNRYAGEANTFGNHVDNAVRTVGPNQRIRTDVSATLFFSDLDSYEGGELVIEDTFGTQRVKLPAGHMVVYPSSSIHRVEPVTSGERVASFFWIESMIRSAEQRRLLYEMDMALLSLRRELGDQDDGVVRLTGTYHNLLRMWGEV
jgi:PKHD-type hydroxylase